MSFTQEFKHSHVPSNVNIGSNGNNNNNNINNNNDQHPQFVKGRLRAKTITTQPVVILPNGKEELQDIGTTLGDLIRYYPNYYLVENFNIRPIVHRSSAYVLKEDCIYKLVKDEYAEDELQVEFTLLHQKLESLAYENSQLHSKIEEILDIATQTRKDQMVVKQTTIVNNCPRCFQSLRFKLSKKCNLCYQVYCSDCTTRVSFPVGFRKNKTILQKPKLCCRLCLSSLFYLRHNPPNDLIAHDPCVKRERLASNSKSIMNSGYVLTKSEETTNHQSLLARIKRKVVQVEHEYDCLFASFFREGSFFSCGDAKVSFPLKFLDPLCRLTFWFSGMNEGDKFDRRTIDRATGTKYTLSNQSSYNQQIVVDVPLEWPKLLSSELCILGKRAPVVTTRVHKMNCYLFLPSKPVRDGSVDIWPVIIFFHGGGFCVGRPTDQIYETACSKIADETGCAVFSVDYRLAPESKFPTQIEDAYHAIVYVHENAEALNLDKTKIIVCGDSAGATLSAVACIMARDRNGPKIIHQILVYPCVVYPLDDNIDSHCQYSDGPILTQKILRWFLMQLFDGENLEEEMCHVYASPLHSNLENLPSATIINAFHDPLRDHGQLYAEKLRSYRIPVTRTVYRKSTHGFFGAPSQESVEALYEICYAIRRVLGIDAINQDSMEQLYKKKLLE